MSERDTSGRSETMSKKGSEKEDESGRTTAASASVDESVEACPFYHGFISRDDVTALLKHRGDFLLRSSQVMLDGEPQSRIVLSIHWVIEGRGGDPLKHYIVGFSKRKGGYFVNPSGPHSATILDLIKIHLGERQFVSNASKALLLNGVTKADWELDHEQLVLETKIGKGAFGEVWKGKLMYQGTTTDVAIKTCTKMKNKEDRMGFMKEARIMRAYNHANVVKLLGVAAKKEPLYIVMELALGGSLLTHLKKTWPGLPEEELLRITLEVARGMEYLESKGCIHRDLAARNCLLDNSKPPTVKISDFGLSSIAKQEQARGGLRIPIKWTAPEALNDGLFSSKSDVWSFGILTMEVWTGGGEPYPGKTIFDVKKGLPDGLRTPLPDSMPTPVKELLAQCWKYDPAARPTFAAVKETLTRIYKEHLPKSNPSR